jgi:hypothetical protein
MARHSRRSRRHRSRSRRMSGGGGAAEFVQGVVGSGDDQWNRTMNQSGSFGPVQSNVIVGSGGQNVQPTTMMPTTAQLNLASGDQMGGRRRRRRGGFLGEVINQAVVPFALISMQNTYRRKRGGKRRSRRTRRHRKH